MTKKTNHQITLKPSYIYWGLAIIVFIILLLIIIPKPKLNKLAVVKSVQVKQLTQAVAGGQPTQWIALVNREDITKKSYLAALPKNAGNIKITTMSADQAKDILKAQQQQASLKEKKAIAEANQPKNYFAASLLDSVSKFLAADLSDAMQTVADIASSQIQTTSDGTAVDLSSQSPAPAETPTPTPDATPAPDLTQTTSPTTEPVTTPDTTPTSTSTVTSTLGSTPTASPAPTVTPVLTTISITPLTATVAPGLTQQLSATALDQNGNSISATFAWSSSNTAVATVDSTGLVTAIASGTANITAQSGSVTGVAPSVIMVSPSDYVAIQYTTSAPTIITQSTATNQQVTVSSTDTSSPASPNAPSANVIASAHIPKRFKDNQAADIHIKWRNKNNSDISFHAYDTTGNGYLDYIEWTVPQGSTQDQTFDIILISKASQLDQSQNFLADIYPQVQAKDNIFATVPASNYVRATFYSTLNNTKDITVYAKADNASTPVSINVFPVYTDKSGNQTEGRTLALVDDLINPNFSSITQYQKYRVLLQNLRKPTDTFDLQITGGSIDIDYIVDPSVTDTFTTETNIGGGPGVETTQVVGATSNTAPFGGIALAPCWTASPGWAPIATTTVRNIANASYTSTVTEYIYCDSAVCILYANNNPGPTATECPATDANVYGGLLWQRFDTSQSKMWASGSYQTNIITGGDIGGTQANGYTVGGNVVVGGSNWIERYYTSPAGSYPAMDACKAIGLGWRLPNILELDSIRDMTTGGGPYSKLPNIASGNYWSSTEYSSSNGWYMNFSSGAASYNGKSSTFYVRCVRGY